MTLLEYQKRLSKAYGYRPLPEKIKWNAQKLYVEHLPAPFFEFLFSGIEGYPLFSKAGNGISRGFSRVVVGDYGAFVEIPKEYLFDGVLQIRRGTEKRLEFPNAKYLWMCPHFGNGEQDVDCKVYKQIKPVSYADYKPGMYYVSPFHLQYVQHDAKPSTAEVNKVVLKLKEMALEATGVQQLTFC